jgi:hypothetical protein
MHSRISPAELRALLRDDPTTRVIWSAPGSPDTYGSAAVTPSERSSDAGPVPA